MLFLVGIGSTFKLHTIRYALIGVGSLLLILATVLILQQPGLPQLTATSRPSEPLGPEVITPIGGRSRRRRCRKWVSAAPTADPHPCQRSTSEIDGEAPCYLAFPEVVGSVGATGMG